MMSEIEKNENQELCDKSDKELNSCENNESEETSFEDTNDADEPESEEAEQGSADVEELEAKKFMLENEIALLEGELERRKAETDRKSKEYSEFKELFPNVDSEELAPEVTELVNSGVPIAAAYALYEKRIESRSAAAAAHNRATKQGGFGSVGRGGESEYYTPDEVRAMSRAEIRQNYKKIMSSMEKWH